MWSPFNFTIRIVRYGFRIASIYLHIIVINIPYFHFIKKTENQTNPCTFRLWFFQKILGFNRQVYWPVDFRSKINQWQNITIGIGVAPGIEPGCYIQGLGKIIIGDYTRIAQNVGIISANHNTYNLNDHNKSSVIIGKYCWIGMNAVILPNTKLGDFTIVGAGSIVTKSFPNGYCVIAGNPAKIIKKLDPKKCIKEIDTSPYVGYIPQHKFNEFNKKNLWKD